MARYLFSYHGGKMPEGEEAVAEGCPVLASGGSVEVGETIDM